MSSPSPDPIGSSVTQLLARLQGNLAQPPVTGDADILKHLEGATSSGPSPTGENAPVADESSGVQGAQHTHMVHTLKQALADAREEIARKEQELAQSRMALTIENTIGMGDDAPTNALDSRGTAGNAMRYLSSGTLSGANTIWTNNKPIQTTSLGTTNWSGYNGMANNNGASAVSRGGNLTALSAVNPTTRAMSAQLAPARAHFDYKHDPMAGTGIGTTSRPVNTVLAPDSARLWAPTSNTMTPPVTPLSTQLQEGGAQQFGSHVGHLTKAAMARLCAPSQLSPDAPEFNGRTQIPWNPQLQVCLSTIFHSLYITFLLTNACSGANFDHVYTESSGSPGLPEPPGPQ